MAALLLLVASLTFTTATPWFAKYDLSASQIQDLTVAECFRGLFGGVVKNGDPRTMSLITCAIDGQEPFAELPENATLCVVEVFSPELVEEARKIVAANPLAAKVLFVGRQELVIANPLGPTASNMCDTDQFPGVAQNVLFASDFPIRPQMGLELNHPVTQRFLNGSLHALGPNPLIDALVAAVSQSNIQNQVFQLATDINGGNVEITRNSYSIPGSACTYAKCLNAAQTYVENTVKSILDGAKRVYTLERVSFQSNMGANIVLRIPGTKSASTIICGAHLDSRNPVLTDLKTAPGADDNGSGSGVLLEFVRVIANQQFEYSLEFHWYIGEEQGLLGSKALSASYKTKGTQVVAMFNTDMIGYTQNNAIVMAFMTGSATTTLTNSCRNVVALYVPTLKTATTSACCSDQESWFKQGYPAIGIFETATSSVVYPDYHKATDTVNKVNYVQLYDFARGFLSCVAEYAIPVK